MSDSYINDSAVLSSESITYRALNSDFWTNYSYFFVVYHEQTEKGFYEAVMFNESITFNYKKNVLCILIPKGMTLMSQFIFV